MLKTLSRIPFNPFIPNTPFLYPLKTSENLTFFWCFQGVEKGCIGNKWVKIQITNHNSKALSKTTSKKTQFFEFFLLLYYHTKLSLQSNLHFCHLLYIDSIRFPRALILTLKWECPKVDILIVVFSACEKKKSFDDTTINDTPNKQNLLCNSYMKEKYFTFFLRRNINKPILIENLIKCYQIYYFINKLVDNLVFFHFYQLFWQGRSHWWGATSISEPKMVQQIQFQTSGILLFKGV